MTARASVDLAVFDVAGTTVLDGDAVATVLQAALARHGCRPSTPEVMAVMGIPKPVAIRHLLDNALPAPPEEIESLVTRIHDEFRASMKETYRSADNIGPAPGIEDVFQALRSAGVKVALDTGFSRDILDVLLDRLEWRDLVDVSIASDEVERGRPFPDLVTAAMARTGVHDPARVAKIGDTPSDLLEGAAAGCGVIVGVTWGTHSRAQLERPGVIVIDTAVAFLACIGLDPA
jgi:phosphonatase-like hydrolase